MGVPSLHTRNLFCFSLLERRKTETERSRNLPINLFGVHCELASNALGISLTLGNTTNIISIAKSSKVWQVQCWDRVFPPSSEALCFADKLHSRKFLLDWATN